MSTPLVEAMAAAALVRLKNFINRATAQQVRRMLEAWRKTDGNT